MLNIDRLISCKNSESTKILKELTDEYNCSPEKIYWTIRSIYGKKLKDLRWDFREPSSEDFNKNLVLTSSAKELRECYPLICNRQWKGIYDRLTGFSTYSKAREQALLNILPKVSVPQTDNNKAMWAACRLGDGSFDKVRGAWRIEHCQRQAGWLERKVEMFIKAFPQASDKITTTTRNTSFWYSKRLSSPGEKFYKIGTCPKHEVIEHLNYFGVWYLFLDDGHYSAGKNQQLITFAVENMEIGTRLAEKLKELSNLDFRVASKNEIRITGTENVIKFHKTFCEPFAALTPECMKYKTTYVKI